MSYLFTKVCRIADGLPLNPISSWSDRLHKTELNAILNFMYLHAVQNVDRIRSITIFVQWQSTLL